MAAWGFFIWLIPPHTFYKKCVRAPAGQAIHSNLFLPQKAGKKSISIAILHAIDQSL